MTFIELSEVLGNLGEFVGAIGVVITLGYLVVQVKQNTKMLRSSIYTSWVETTSQLHFMRADHAELHAEIYGNPGRQFRYLNPTERIKHEAFFGNLFNTFEMGYLTYLEGAFGEETFTAKHRNMVSVLSGSPLLLSSWRSADGGPWDERFVDYINGTVIPEVENNNNA